MVFHWLDVVVNFAGLVVLATVSLILTSTETISVNHYKDICPGIIVLSYTQSLNKGQFNQFTKTMSLTMQFYRVRVLPPEYNGRTRNFYL